MKKLGTVSAVVLATVLSAVAAQAAEPVRPASSEMKPAKAEKADGTTVAPVVAIGAGAALLGIILAVKDNDKQSSPGGN